MANWIGFYTGEVGVFDKYGAICPLLKRVFSISEVNYRKATLRITSLGLFSAYVNGEKISNDCLLPAWTDYNKRLYYYDFDVTKLLVSGDNSLCVYLGDGYYVGNVAWVHRNNYGAYPLKLWCELIIENDNGVDRIISDESWMGTKSHIVASDIINGEKQDGRLFDKRIYEPNFNYGCWQKVCSFNNVKVTPIRSIAENTVKKETFEGIYLKNGIYDFGQNFAGVVRLEIEGSNSAEIEIYHGEMLTEDCSLYTQNLRSALACDSYICKGGSETFEPLFTYHGFRYIQIKTKGNVIIKKVTGIAIHSDIEFTSDFHCSDDNINKLYNNVIWSQKSNFVGLPTDCPQRDERLGWTGDAEIFCETAMYLANSKRFFDKYLTDIRDAQYENGMVDSVAPLITYNLDEQFGAPGWGDAIAIIPYTHYQFYNDKKIIADNIENAKKWLEYCLSDSKNYIRNSRGYGDWLNVNDPTDNQIVATLYMGYTAYLIGEMCHYIDDRDEKIYKIIFNRIKKSFINKFTDKDKKIKSDSQTAYLLAYSFKFMPKKSVRPHLIRLLQKSNYHLTCGFLGVKYILPCLCEIGLKDIAYKLITSTDYPSWCYPVVNGATTIWERWNSYSKENGFGDVGMNSFNHYSLGSSVSWLFKYMLGIKIDKDGFTVKPYLSFNSTLTSANGSYKYLDKYINISFVRENNKIIFSIESNAKVKVNLRDYKVKKLNKFFNYEIYEKRSLKNENA